MTAPRHLRRTVGLALGWALLVLAAPVGLLPGPGGIFLVAGGLALILRNSAWAKRRYVLLKRRWPKLGRIADRALRRRLTRKPAMPMPRP